ncbi:hypothetical protein DV515_00018686, partial [Chloebia gouldiae]
AFPAPLYLQPNYSCWDLPLSRGIFGVGYLAHAFPAPPPLARPSLLSPLILAAFIGPGGRQQRGCARVVRPHPADPGASPASSNPKLRSNSPVLSLPAPADTHRAGTRAGRALCPHLSWNAPKTSPGASRGLCTARGMVPEFYLISRRALEQVALPCPHPRPCPCPCPCPPSLSLSLSLSLS